MNDLRSTGPLWPPLAGAGVAVAVTTAMDAGGLAMFSALALLPLTLLFWYLGRRSRHDLGLVLGSGEGYRWALLYPLVVPGLLTAAAFAFGAVDLTEAEWGKALRNIALASVVGTLGTLLTEEGFFRGWLWAAFKKAGRGDTATLIWTSVLFTVWHLSAVLLDTEFAPPDHLVPVYLVNATLLGFNWGAMRLLSGSVLAPAISHAVWNGLVYALFGFGEKVGELGIAAYGIYGPELGLLGIVGNGLFALLMWRRIQGRKIPTRR